MPIVQDNALLLLKGIYDQSGGDTAEWVDVSKVSHPLGMTEPSARAGVYRPRLLRHLSEAYAARAAVES